MGFNGFVLLRMGGNILLNDVLNTFYIRLCDKGLLR